MGIRKSNLRPLAALILAAVAIVGAYAAIHFLIRLPNAPYNVRELFPRRYRPVYIAAFSVLLVWIGFAPAWIGDFLARRPRYVPFLPIWASGVGLVSWFLLRFSVTLESQKDILGAPRLEWGGDWEQICRFLALQGLVCLSLLVASVAAGGVYRLGRRRGVKVGGLALLSAAPWIILCWLVVVEWADTDNLTELIRSVPAKWVGPVWLTLLLGVIAAGAAVLARALAGPGILKRLVAVGLAVLLTGPGWALLYLGLEPAVEKYGLTFPAIRFLLGPDRRVELPWSVLFLRWAGVQLALMAMLAWGGLIALCMRPRQGGLEHERQTVECERPARQDTPGSAGKVYLIITIFYVAFLFYGCLVPFDIQSMSFGRAWAVFRQSVGLTQAVWSQSDMVTNVMMFVPLTFCALGAWSRENTRPGRWFMAPAIFVAGVALSISLEFTQVFAPSRIVSIHDIISQTIGNAIGIGSWLLVGMPLTRWVRGLIGERSGPSFCVRLLYTYAALFVLYQLLPLNLTISATQIFRKYKQGMINLFPFCDPTTVDLYPLIMKTAVYVPIGYLLAIRTGHGRRPLLLAVLGGFLFSCGLEMLQVFVRSRLATSTDIVLGTVGAALGGWFACLFGPVARGAGVHGKWWKRYGRWIELAVVALWLCAMVWKRWYPFHFRWPADGLGQRITAVLSVPLFDIVRRLDPLQGTARLVREFGAFLVLGMLIQSLLAPTGGWRRVLALVLTIALAMGAEFGRFFFSRHQPDMSVMLMALAGCAASVWAYPRFIRTFLKRPDAPSP